MKSTIVLLALVCGCFVRTLEQSNCLVQDEKSWKKCLENERQMNDMMERKLMDNANVKCNDGSKAGYYIRENKESNRWIVYLEGGLFCNDELSCTQRMQESNPFSMMSSNMWPERRNGDGLLNSDQFTNPLFYNANHVYIPYCSSDLWIGNTTRTFSNGKKVNFHGSRIIRAVIKQLLSQLSKASSLVFAGSSAGGIGVLQNVDAIATSFQPLNVQVKAVIDSAFFLEHSSRCTGCPNASKQQFQLAVKFWEATLPSYCTQGYKCLFAENIFSHLKTPTFVFQWLYDTVQIMSENNEMETDPQVMFNKASQQHVMNLGVRMRHILNALPQKHGIFAASCIAHTALTKWSNLKEIDVHGKLISDVIKCWLTPSKQRTSPEGVKCSHRLVDRCEPMSCRKNCPAIRHPRTGERILLPHQQTGRGVIPRKTNG